jgi:uncharacterized protein YneR
MYIRLRRSMLEESYLEYFKEEDKDIEGNDEIKIMIKHNLFIDGGIVVHKPFKGSYIFVDGDDHIRMYTERGLCFKLAQGYDFKAAADAKASI